MDSETKTDEKIVVENEDPLMTSSDDEDDIGASEPATTNGKVEKDTDDDVVDDMKKDPVTSDIKTSVDSTNLEDDAPDAAFHYYVFAMLYMLGFMLHCRKYFDWNCAITMAHLAAYIACPSPSVSWNTGGGWQDRLREGVFLSFLIFCIYSTIESSPYNANHHNVMGFISLLLLPMQLQRFWAGPINTTSSRKTDTALNLVRCAVVTMYFLAGFHKINDDFIFHHKESCAYDMLWDYLDFFDLREYEDLENLPWFLKTMPYLGLFIELAPPLMLCFPSMQKIGVLLLIKLHWLLLPVGFADFGSIAQSFLWLFVAPTRAAKALPHHLYGQMAGCFVFFELITIILWVHRGDKGRKDVPLQNEEATLVFSAFALVWLNVLRVKGLSGVPIRLPKSVFSLGALAMFILFAFNPYLGLRTTGTLSMFSNLRTEGATSNHLLLRSNPIKFWNYQEDVVEILACAEDFDQIKPGWLYQKLAFDRVMKQELEYGEEEVYLKVKYQDQVFETQDLNKDPTFDVFRQEESWFSRKYFDFRDIQKEGPQVCEW